MKKIDRNGIEFIPLKKDELTQINGGATPGEGTSFANDIAYYITYGLLGLRDLAKGFSRGAARGQSLRFSG
jgi:hypothetical protein